MLNLDAMSLDELRDAADAFARLERYAVHKRIAMQCRLAGKIVTAVEHEDACQQIYDRLPKWAKW